MIGTKTARRLLLRRALAVGAVAAVLALPMGLAPASAEPDYPPVFHKITASAFYARVGQSVTFTAQTYRPSSQVAVDVSVKGTGVDSGTAKANAKGVATTSVTFTTTGVNTVTMSGTSVEGDPLSLSAQVTVTASDDAVGPVDDGSDAGGIPILGGGLPRTGAQIAATALVATVLVGLGALLVVVTRRRRTS